MGHSKVELAKEFCIHYHAGQFRKGSNQPYHSHPIALTEILAKYGYDDEVTQCMALLHDTVEDTALKLREIKEAFGFEIEHGVYILSKNTIDDWLHTQARHLIPGNYSKDDLYKLRLLFSRKKNQESESYRRNS